MKALDRKVVDCHLAKMKLLRFHAADPQPPDSEGPDSKRTKMASAPEAIAPEAIAGMCTGGNPRSRLLLRRIKAHSAGVTCRFLTLT